MFNRVAHISPAEEILRVEEEDIVLEEVDHQDMAGVMGRVVVVEDMVVHQATVTTRMILAAKGEVQAEDMATGAGTNIIPCWK